jgi:hypothetical protein
MVSAQDGSKIVMAHINGKVNLLDLNGQTIQQVGQVSIEATMLRCTNSTVGL